MDTMYLDAHENTARDNLWLPKKMVPCQIDFEILGFTFKDISGNKVLCQATLPIGWKLEASQNDKCYTYIIDPKGHKRGLSYYSYSSSSVSTGQMNLYTRFRINAKPQSPLVGVEGPFTVFVQDSINDSVLFTAGKCDVLYTWKYNALVQKAKTYLQTRYPCWEKPLEYWD